MAAAGLPAGEDRRRVLRRSRTRPTLDKKFKHDIDIVVDRLVTKDGPGEPLRRQPADRAEPGRRHRRGRMGRRGRGRGASRAGCSSPRSSPARSPASPSARSSRGCSRSTTRSAPARPATAWASKLAFDADLVVPDKDKTLHKGAVAPWAQRPLAALHPDPAGAGAPLRLLDGRAVARSCRSRPRQVILHGSGAEKIKFIYDDNARKYEVTKTFEGVLPNLERRWRETDSRLGARGAGPLPVRDARARPAAASA